MVAHATTSDTDLSGQPARRLLCQHAPEKSANKAIGGRWASLRPQIWRRVGILGGNGVLDALSVPHRFFYAITAYIRMPLQARGRRLTTTGRKSLPPLVDVAASTFAFMPSGRLILIVLAGGGVISPFISPVASSDGTHFLPVQMTALAVFRRLRDVRRVSSTSYRRLNNFGRPENTAPY